MGVLSHLEPKRLFEIFEALCAIPHGSGNTRALGDWCEKFGRERGLEVHRDGAGNVVLIAPAAPGYENAPALILQGHLDMVCQKEPDCPRDMEKEGLELFVEGDSVGARGTTLGGDDGVAVAMALAAIEDPALPRPRLEVVLTTDEETGMEGAAGLDVSPLRGRQLLNIDSEDEGVFTVGCAGGCRVSCRLPVRRRPFDGADLSLRVEGLAGGHSGVEIHRGRANANILLGRALGAAGAAGAVRLVSARGGEKDNAIPTAAEALIRTAAPEAVTAAVEALARDLKKEYRTADPGVRFSVRPWESLPFLPMDEESTRRCLCLLTCAPNGVQEMSQDIPGLVQTSLNLGILACDEETFSADFSLRSSLESQKGMLRERLSCLTEQLGGRTETWGDYPAWEYLPDSPLRRRMEETFRDLYGREARVETIHAGLECGLLSKKLPGLDCVSFGPDLTDIHTPRERMHIASLQRTWALLREVLRRSR